MTFIQTLSTYSALLPIIIGSFAVKGSRVFLFLWFFLVYGFVTDQLSMLYFVHGLKNSIGQVAVINQNIYSLVEGVFYVLFTGTFFEEKTNRQWMNVLGFFVGFFWILVFVILRENWFLSSTMSSVYDPSYHLIVAVFSAIILLNMTKSGKRSPRSMVWLMIGVFFYNFCSFYVSSFIDSSITKEVWFIYSSLNIMTMFIYAFSFFLETQRIRNS
jgi:hypothetical protein